MDDFGRTHARTHKNMFDDEAALLGLSSLLSTPWMSMGQPEGELNFSHPTKIPSQLIKMPNLVVIAIVLEECKGKTNNGSPCGRVGVKLWKFFYYKQMCQIYSFFISILSPVYLLSSKVRIWNVLYQLEHLRKWMKFYHHILLIYLRRLKLGLEPRLQNIVNYRYSNMKNLTELILLKKVMLQFPDGWEIPSIGNNGVYA